MVLIFEQGNLALELKKRERANKDAQKSTSFRGRFFKNVKMLENLK